MSKKLQLSCDSRIQKYLEALSETSSEPSLDFLSEVNSVARSVSLPSMELSALEARMLGFFVSIIKPKKVLELGTLAGASALTIAAYMPQQKDGAILTCEFNPRALKAATTNFSRYHGPIQIKLLPGKILENIDSIVAFGPYDLIFIDADKLNYTNYFHLASKCLKQGGLLLADNTLSQGLVAQNDIDLPDLRLQTNAVRDFNALVASCPNFTSFLFPTGEGFTAAVRK